MADSAYVEPQRQTDVKLIRDLDTLPDSLRGGAVAIGNFDGVHLGHVEIVEKLVAKATQIGGAAVVFTFDPHPAAILRPGRVPPPLTSTTRKAQLLGQLGTDATIAYPTNEAFLKLAPREFFAEVVLGRLGARALVEGYNFSFGRNRGGHIDALADFCHDAGVSLDVVAPVLMDGQAISSSRIRQLLTDGMVEEARRMLTHPYRIRGIVIHGAGRGRQLGFPTANLDRVDSMLPGVGIYAGLTEADGRTWPAAISVGPNPTFGEGALKIEVHLVDYHGSLYDRYLEVDFLAWLRDIQRFATVDELVRQMDRDIAATRQLVVQAA